MKLATQISLGFALIILFSVIGSSVDLNLSSAVRKNSNFLIQSEAIIRTSSRLHRIIIEMQSGFRGYLLTSNEHFLESYYRGFKEVPVLIKEEKRLVRETPSQVRKIDSIDLLHDQWLVYSKSLIEAKKEYDSGGSADKYFLLFKSKLQKEVGKKINDEIAAKFREFDKNEYKVRFERRAMLNKSIRRTRTISIVINVIVFIIGVISAMYITYNISRRINGMVKLAEKISKGEFRVIKDTKKDELTELSHSLNIMSERLLKSFTELAKKNRELDQFAYVVSHDLKAPLRGLHNVLAWIEEDHSGEISPGLKKYHELMNGRILRLEALITGLLEYARIGRDKLETELVDVHEMLIDLSRLIVPKSFSLTFTGEFPLFETNRLSLEQVFTNLLSNAVKHHGKMYGNIELKCRSIDRYYEFTVKDDGKGIPEMYHEKIFQIFQTLREKNQEESTGIGLAIVKKIVDEYKGVIKVESDTDNGFSISFTWPK